ncbi:hypothetical protein BJD99_14425 [Rhodococcus sp. 1163]|nr:hypothetical protein BJD99_14425 [Rhodococcus sp. 1163]
MFIAAFAVLVFVALFKGVANGSWLATAGFAGLAIVFVIMAAHMSGIAGIRYVSLSRRVRSCDHPRYGTGVEMLRPPLLSTRFRLSSLQCGIRIIGVDEHRWGDTANPVTSQRSWI